MTPAQATPACVVHDEAWISRLYHLKVDTTTRDGDGSFKASFMGLLRIISD